MQKNSKTEETRSRMAEHGNPVSWNMSQLLSWFKLAFFGRSQYNDLHYWRTRVICQVWQTFPFWRSTGDAGPCRERWGGLCWAHKAAFWTKQESFHSRSAQTQAVQLNPLALVLIWYTTLHKNTMLTKHRQNICCTHWCWSYRANSACTCMAGAFGQIINSRYRATF